MYVISTEFTATTTYHNKIRHYSWLTLTHRPADHCIAFAIDGNGNGQYFDSSVANENF